LDVMGVKDAGAQAMLDAEVDDDLEAHRRGEKIEPPLDDLLRPSPLRLAPLRVYHSL
jgi:hypothetical protein